LNLRPLRPEGVLARVEHGWLSGEVVRVRPSRSAELGGRRYSVGYSVCGPLVRLLPAPLPPAVAGHRERSRPPAGYPAEAGATRYQDSACAPPPPEGRQLQDHSPWSERFLALLPRTVAHGFGTGRPAHGLKTTSSCSMPSLTPLRALIWSGRSVRSSRPA
jgi:hypothetical protein